MSTEEATKKEVAETAREVSAVFACAKAHFDAVVKPDWPIQDFTDTPKWQRDESYRGVRAILTKLGLPMNLDIGETQKLIVDGLESSLPQGVNA